MWLRVDYHIRCAAVVAMFLASAVYWFPAKTLGQWAWVGPVAALVLGASIGAVEWRRLTVLSVALFLACALALFFFVAVMKVYRPGAGATVSALWRRPMLPTVGQFYVGLLWLLEGCSVSEWLAVLNRLVPTFASSCMRNWLSKSQQMGFLFRSIRMLSSASRH